MTNSQAERVVVERVVSSRYQDGVRPESWDARREGVDIIALAGGRTIRLWSDGGQSPPRPGWHILLTSAGPENSQRWTLYGVGQPAN